MDYIYIRAYCRFMNSADYYLLGELRRARAENAPADAISSSDDGFYTVESLSPESRAVVERIASDVRDGQ